MSILKQLLLVAIAASSLTGCQKIITVFDNHVLKLLERNAPKETPQVEVEAFDSVVIGDDKSPSLIIRYAYGSSHLSDAELLKLRELIDEQSVYVLDATAGGVGADSLRIARERLFAATEFFIAHGVERKRIKISVYDPSKEGRRLFVYVNR